MLTAKEMKAETRNEDDIVEEWVKKTIQEDLLYQARLGFNSFTGGTFDDLRKQERSLDKRFEKFENRLRSLGYTVEIIKTENYYGYNKSGYNLKISW